MHNKISIVTPSFNQGKFIERTIKSVINQKYPNLEYIIIDGGSTDDTVNIIKKYAKHITYWESKKDRGQAHALNKGFKKATGEILAYLNSDDTLVPGALEAVNNYFQFNPKVRIASGVTKWIDHKDRDIEFYTSFSDFIKPTDSSLNKLKKGCYIAQPSTFMRRSLFNKVGKWSENYHYAFDYDYWIRAARLTEIEPIHLHLANTRLHKATKTSTGGLQSFEEVKRLQHFHFGQIYFWTVFVIADLLAKNDKRYKSIWYRNTKRITNTLYLYHQMGKFPPLVVYSYFIRWLIELVPIPKSIKKSFKIVLKAIKLFFISIFSRSTYSKYVALISIVGRRYLELGKLNQHPPKQAYKEIFPKSVFKPKKFLKISIVTPSFNQGKFIERTIKSVINQKYPNLEYIIIDGGSTDDTVNIIKKYAKHITYWESKKDRGQAHALNKGFKKATGEILAYLNSDDMLTKGSLFAVNDHFLNSKSDVIYGNRIILNSSYQQIGRWVLAKHDDLVMKHTDYIPQETLFWRRSLWQKVRHFDEKLQFAMDWDIIQKFMSFDARFCHIPYFLGCFLVHQDQKTTGSFNSLGFREVQKIQKKYLTKNLTVQALQKAELFKLKSAAHSFFFDLGIRLK